MKQNAIVAGVGMTPFGKHLDRGLQSLAQQAIGEALADAGIAMGDIQAAWAGTAAAGIITGQVCIAGQTILRGMGVGGIPVVNVENACATASTAFQQACTMVTLGAYDVVLAFGVEKLHHADKSRTMQIFSGSIDTERPLALLDYLTDDLSADEIAAAPKSTRSLFMDIYARMTRGYMAASGAEARHFAMVSAKNSRHGSLNPNAQFRTVMSAEEVLAARLIAAPLTLPMCSSIADGASAAVIVSPRAARRLGIAAPVHVLASMLGSGADTGERSTSSVETIGRETLELAGVTPRDLDCVETHDATSPAELMQYEALGLCEKGGGPALIESGATAIGGRIPVNMSGGLVRKGHPIGATGLGQIYELVQQLRGRAGARQVADASVALAENGGGFIDREEAAIVITVLAR